MVTDSTSSLDPADAVRADISIIPLQVVIDDLSRPESDVGPREVAAALRAGRRVTTSRPTPDVIGHTYAELEASGYDAIVSVHLSSKISGTYGAAQVAAASVRIPMIVVDSMTLAMAVGFAVLAGAEVARSGAAPADVAAQVRRRAAAATTYFYVDSLEYLRRGGRIGTAAAMLGSALAVKPLLQQRQRVSHAPITDTRRQPRLLDKHALQDLGRDCGQILGVSSRETFNHRCDICHEQSMAAIRQFKKKGQEDSAGDKELG